MPPFITLEDISSGRVASFCRASFAAVLVLIIGGCTAAGGADATNPVIPRAAVSSVGVTPAAASLSVGGAPVLFSATVRDARGANLASREVVWSSGNTAVASISSDGVVSAVAPGSAMITATAEGVAGSASVTVTQPPTATVSVSPSTASLAVGGVQALVATLRDASGAVLTGRPVSWVSSNPGIAAVSAGGVVSAVSDGQVTVTATSEGQRGTADVSVRTPVTRVELSVDTLTLLPGGTLAIAVTVRGGAGTVLTNRTVVWRTTNPAVATVTSAGAVTAVAIGQATITATSEGIVGQLIVRVQDPAIRNLTLTPLTADRLVGQTLIVVPRVTRSDSSVGVLYTFSTSNAAVATVASTGVIAAQAPGIAVITVTAIGTGPSVIAQTLTAASTITVAPPQPGLTNLVVAPASAALETGATQPLTVSVSGPRADSAVILYSSNSPSIVTVTPTGTLTAVAPGSAIVTVQAITKQADGYLATTKTVAIPVSVRPAATVALASITAGPSDFPVDVTNISGEMRVGLDLVTNGNTVTAVRLFVCPVGGQCPASAAAEQAFGSTGATSGRITLAVNTADFSVASDWSGATAHYLNGDKRLVAQIVSGTTTTFSSNSAVVRFNNADNFAVRHTVPTRSWIGPDGSVRYGGLGQDGLGSITVVPVMYTPGRTLRQASVNVTGTACSNTPIQFIRVLDAYPWTLTYGGFSSVAAPLGSTNRRCAGVSAGADLTVAIGGVYDNAGVLMRLPTAFATSSNGMPVVGLPAVIRADYSQNVDP
jgi:uncharacterized protein YjdB